MFEIHLFGLQTSSLWLFNIYSFIIHKQSNCFDLANHCFPKLLIYSQHKACLISMPILKFSKYHALFETRKSVSRPAQWHREKQMSAKPDNPSLIHVTQAVEEGNNSCKLFLTSRHMWPCIHALTPIQIQYE